MKTGLDAMTMEAAVLGGAVLGCGGGGKLEDGLYLGEMAAAQEGAALVDPAALAEQASAATVMPFYTSGYNTHQIEPRQAQRAMTLLQGGLETAVSGVVNGGQGAVESILGWELSALLKIPLLDSGIRSAYHPASLQNLLRFRQQTAAGEKITLSLAGRFGTGQGHREYLWHGRPTDLLDKLAALPTEKESYVAAVGPLPVDDGTPALVGDTLHIGQTLLDVLDEGGEAAVAALKTHLPWRFAALATVTDIEWRGEGQEAYGLIELRDIKGRRLQLTFGQRYRALLVDGCQIAVFPDLIITLGILGTPLTGEEVFIGQDLYLIVVPQE